MATQLRRAMGLRTVVSASTGLAFAAVEYLAAAGLVSYVAGDAAWLAVAVAGGLLLLVWGYFSELNGLYPTAAAIRLYMARAMDDRVALTITFTYLLTIVLVVAADAYIIGSAIAYVFGQASWVAVVYIALLLIAATVANLRGVRVAGAVQDGATYTVLAGTVLIAIIGLARDGFALRAPLNPVDAGHPLTSFVSAVALAIFLYSAFEWVTTNAEEVRDPRHIHRGMLISLGALFITCALITLAMSHLLTSAELATAYPQLYLAQRAAGSIGLIAMLAVTALTALNTFNGAFLTASRFMYATAREGSLPQVFAQLNDKAAPWAPVIALGAASLVCATLVAVTGSWQALVATGAALESMIYATAAYCVIRLRVKSPESARPFKMALALVLAPVGLVIFTALALLASVTVGPSMNITPLVIILFTGALSALYVTLVIPKLKRREAARRAARGRRRPQRPVESSSNFVEAATIDQQTIGDAEF
ncbi:MAG TPA: APC family permease [Ktedonobacterales bacterium]